MPKNIIITPKCCEEIQKSQIVTLLFDSDAIYDSDGQEDHKPKWKGAGWAEELNGYRNIEIKFCPHCATPVPEIKRRITEKKIARISDGGYSCDTCGATRMHECDCYAPEYAWEPI